MDSAARLSRIDQALSSRHWQWDFYPETPAPKRLLEALTQLLPTIPEASWQERFNYGGVFINGRPARGDTELPLPCRIEYFEPKMPFEAVRTPCEKLDDSHVVYRDDDILAVYKPPGISSMPTREQHSHNLEQLVTRYVGGKVHMPSRLDTSAQGIVLISIRKQMHKALQRVFENRLIHKTYLLALSGIPEWEELELRTGITRDKLHPILRRTVPEGTPGSQLAETHFALVATRDIDTDGQLQTAIVRARPRTGRTHQLRVHTASLGLPIVGDNFYGGPKAPELRLLAYRFQFTHPLTRARLDIHVPDERMPAWMRLTPAERHRVLYG